MLDRKKYYKEHKDKYVIYRLNQKHKKELEEKQEAKEISEMLKNTFIGADTYEEGAIL